MKYEYFANVLAQVKFKVEAPNEEAADEKASAIFEGTGWDEFIQTGYEIGRITGPGDWVLVEHGGDLT